MAKGWTWKKAAALAAAVLLPTLAAQAAPPWWNARWAWRRPVAVDRAAPTALPGLDAAVVTFSTAGLAREDANDVRVVAADGAEAPCRVLQAGPGDQVRVVFTLRDDSRNYHVYFGNAEAQGPESLGLKLQRGLIHEAREYRGGRIDTLDDVRALARQGTLLGRNATDRVFLGYNPFGETQRIVSTFSGHFWANDDGVYVFATASRNASFLLVDGEALVKNGGRHGPESYERHVGSVRLSRGLHRLEVLHASDGGDPVVAVAWQPPRRRMEIMPAEAFAPLFRASAGVLESREGTPCADIDAVHAGEAWAGEHPVQRVLLRASLGGRRAGDVQWQWDFGDGQKAAGAEAEHVYLVAGVYAVAVTCRTGGDSFQRRMRLAVSRPWAAMGHLKADDAGHCAAIVSKYDFVALDSGSLLPAIELLRDAKLHEAALAACEALWRRRDTRPGDVEEALPAYLETLRTGRDDAAIARRLLADAAAASVAPAAALHAAAGQMYLDHGQADAALRLFQHAQKTTTGAAERRVQIGIGDACRLRGDARAAALAYAAADPHTVPAGGDFLRRGDFARTTEDFIRRGRLDEAAETLTRWQETLPADKMQGFWTLHRVRLLLATHDYAAAQREGFALLAVNAASPHAAEVLMLTAQALQAAGRTDDAVAAWKRLAASYPESVFADMARTNAGLHTTKQ